MSVKARVCMRADFVRRGTMPTPVYDCPVPVACPDR